MTVNRIKSWKRKDTKKMFTDSKKVAFAAYSRPCRLFRRGQLSASISDVMGCLCGQRSFFAIHKLFSQNCRYSKTQYIF